MVVIGAGPGGYVAAIRAAQLGHVAEEVERAAADRRQEDLEVRPRHQFGIHAAGLLVQAAAQVGFVETGLVERVAAFAVRQGQRRGDADVVLGDLGGAAPRSMGARRPGDHQVGAHAVDVESGTHTGDGA